MKNIRIPRRTLLKGAAVAAPYGHDLNRVGQCGYAAGQRADHTGIYRRRQYGRHSRPIRRPSTSI